MADCGADCETIACLVAECGITTLWTPRISQGVALLLALVPPLVCVLVYAVGVWKGARRFISCFQIFRSRLEDIQIKFRCCSNYCLLPSFIRQVRFVLAYLTVIPVLTILLDVFDISADCYYFYNLEMGLDSLLAAEIMRNGTVISLMLVFAALGVIKSFTVIALIWEAIDLVSTNLRRLVELPPVELEKLGHRKLVPIHKGEPGRFMVAGTSFKIVRNPAEPGQMESCDVAYRTNKALLETVKADNLAKFKPLILISGLVLEDAAETILEYFYVDLYLTKKNTLVIINATLMAIVATISLLIELKNYKGALPAIETMFGTKKRAIYIAGMLYIPVILGTLGQAVRAYLTCDQAYHGTIRRDCLEVSDGALYQVPWSCARATEWLMLGSTVVGVGLGLASLLVFVVVWYRRGNLGLATCCRKGTLTGEGAGDRVGVLPDVA